MLRIKHTHRAVYATHTLHHRWHFVPSHARPSSDAASVHRRHELDECHRCMFVHVSMSKEDVLAFNVTQNTQIVKFIWLILSTIRQNGYCVIDTSKVCYFWCFSQGSVATHCRCGGKYDTNLVANLLLGPTVKTFRKSVNNYQSYEWISSGMFL